jgi:hypothetical protein
MTWREHLRPKHVALDVAVLGVALVGSNLLIDPAHPGWTHLNPSPYVLLPILLGGRYGFTTGLLTGAATSAVIAGWHMAVGTPSLRAAIAAAPFLHASLVILGGLAGELYDWLRREHLTAEAHLEKARVSVRRLDADVRYLRSVKDELDRTVAARDGEVSTLDAELRRLYAAAPADLPEAILQFLKRQVRLSDAALYSVGPDDQPLPRLSLIGHDAHLPPLLARDASDVARLAMARASLVTLPELLRHEAPPAAERVLLAAPLPDANNQVRTLLVVTGLPFISFTPQTANLIALICEWGGEVLDLASGAAGRYRIAAGTENQRIFTRDHLVHLLRLSLDAYQLHRLPSSLVVFELPGAPRDLQARFEQVLLGAVRAGDFAAEMGWTHPHLVVLLPLTGERGAKIFMDRCRQFLRPSENWPVTATMRRVDVGHADDVPGILAELADRDAAAQ